MAYCVACGLCASMMIKEIGGLEKIGYFALFSFLMYVCLCLRMCFLENPRQIFPRCVTRSPLLWKNIIDWLFGKAQSYDYDYDYCKTSVLSYLPSNLALLCPCEYLISIAPLKTLVMTSSVPPPPLDDPDESDPIFCPPLKWGILGCGRVSHDFSQALKHLPTQSIVACSARSADSAEKFAEKHKIGKHYGSYDEMLKDPEVEIVYVGNIHSYRREIGEKCLMHSKHVLIEKPFACSVEDGEYLISLAKERNLFIMEGMWTRFFPAVQKARDLAMGSDKLLGEIAAVYSDFNFNAADSDAYPSSFLYQRKLGGGANLLVAPYPIAAASMFFGGRMPEDIKAVGQVDKEMEVELQAAVVLSFSPTDTEKPTMGTDNDDDSPGNIYPKLPGAGVAMLSYGFLCETPEETVVVGSKGRMKIGSPGHCPTMLSIDLKADGRGNLGKTLNFEYPLPEDTKEIIDSGGYFYPNSAGFLYEAAAVARCIASGKREAPQFTLEETMLNLRVIEDIRNQLGVKAFDED